MRCFPSYGGENVAFGLRMREYPAEIERRVKAAWPGGADGLEERKPASSSAASSSAWRSPGLVVSRRVLLLTSRWARSTASFASKMQSS